MKVRSAVELQDRSQPFPILGHLRVSLDGQEPSLIVRQASAVYKSCAVYRPRSWPMAAGSCGKCQLYEEASWHAALASTVYVAGVIPETEDIYVRGYRNSWE